MSKVSNDVLERLRAAVGAAGATDDPQELAPHLVELRQRWTGSTPLLLKPSNADEVSHILQICSETRTPIVPQGGNTGLVGGQIPTHGEVLLSLERMRGIRELSAADGAITVEAGTILAQVQKAADDASCLFPLSLSAEGSCTIGGNLSTNAGGIHVLRYGMMRELVLGIEVVLADGTILDLMRGLRKDNTGYDLKQIFIGAEGTLGIITAAKLKLFPKPHGHVTVFAGLADVKSAVPLLHELQSVTGGLVTAFELIARAALDNVLRHMPGTSAPLPDYGDWTVLFEIAFPRAFDPTGAVEEVVAEALEDGVIADAVFARGERDRQAFWRLREAVPDAQRAAGPAISNDISVVPTRVAELIRNAYAAIERTLPGARPYAFGHVGDGNIHLTVRPPEGRDDALLTVRHEIERAILDEVGRLGGSISAEHGLGLAKNEAIARYKSGAEIALMRKLKNVLDPGNILNPGKVLPAVGTS